MNFRVRPVSDIARRKTHSLSSGCYATVADRSHPTAAIWGIANSIGFIGLKPLSGLHCLTPVQNLFKTRY